MNNDSSQPDDNAESGPTPIESSSHTAWLTITFMLLGILVLVFCSILLFVYLRKKRLPLVMVRSSTMVPAVSTTSKGEGEELGAEPIVDVMLAHEDITVRIHKFWAFIIMAISAIVALSLSIVTHTSCEYMEVDTEYGSGFLSLGLWSVALTYDGSTGSGGDGTCYSNVVWDVEGRDDLDFEVNAALQIARVAGIIATTFGGIFFVSMITSHAFSSTLSKQLFRPWLSVILLLVAFCQGLTLSLGASQPCHNETCFIDVGAVSACTAGLHWLVCAFAVLIVS